MISFDRRLVGGKLGIGYWVLEKEPDSNMPTSKTIDREQARPAPAQILHGSPTST